MFVDHNETGPQQHFVTDQLQATLDKDKDLGGHTCDCIEAAARDFPTCEDWKPQQTTLNLFKDLCSVQRRCSHINPQILLDVGKKCTFGDPKKTSGTIIDDMCDEKLKGNECESAVKVRPRACGEAHAPRRAASPHAAGRHCAKPCPRA